MGTGNNFQNLRTTEAYTSLYLPAQESRELLPTVLRGKVFLAAECGIFLGFGLHFFLQGTLYLHIFVCSASFCSDYLC